MERFASGEADVLVATTVIEVGIDVPNATVMLVEDAERYGISQLHQLRGRVGRGEHASLCLLFGPKESPRLQALAEHGDGFALAEIDLELRGRGRAHRHAPVRHGPLPRRPAARRRRRARARPRVRRAQLLAEDAALDAPEHAAARRRARRAVEARARRGVRVRVIAGRFGGRRLAAPPGRDTRPTSDRVREALFSILGPLDGERVLDLFAGSGALGIEALSRGRGQRAVRARRDSPPSAPSGPTSRRSGIETRRWCATTPGGYCATHTRAATPTIWSSSTLHTGRRRGGRRTSPSARARRPRTGGRVVTESDRRAPLDLELPLTDERRYGDTLIRIHTHEP